MSKLIFGCGYLGKRVAQMWKRERNTVMAVTRSDERALELAKAGLFTIGADVTKPETLDCLEWLARLKFEQDLCPEVPRLDTVLFAVGYDRESGRSIEDVYAGGIKNVLEALPADTGRFIYISTSGVYGPAGGDWVDETTPPDPQRDGARASLAAERDLTEHPLGKRGIILRLAGIYGPGRLPYLEALRRGEPLAAPTDGFLNLIQVADAAAAVLAAERLPLDNGNWPQIINISDGHPVERGEFYREVARRLGAPEPTFVTPEAGSPRAARAASDKRISNERMRQLLGVRLTYPSYREGLADALGFSDSR